MGIGMFGLDPIPRDGWETGIQADPFGEWGYLEDDTSQVLPIPWVFITTWWSLERPPEQDRVVIGTPDPMA